MIVRLIALKDFCYLKSPLFKGLNISEINWKNIQEVCNILKSVAELPVRLQHEQLDVTLFVAIWKLALFKVKIQNTNEATKWKTWKFWKTKKIIGGAEELFAESLIHVDVEDNSNSEMSEYFTFMNYLAKESSSLTSSQAVAKKKSPSVVESELVLFDSLPSCSKHNGFL